MPEVRANAVHPHARGEMMGGAIVEQRADGSSPRTWGNGRVKGKDHLPIRFIPTHVGKWAVLTGAHGLETVHPHARGEMLRDEPSRRRPAGSSPRTWGNVKTGWVEADRSRFIPTHVGKWP